MPRFFFHLLAGSDRVEDETGLELPSALDAIEEGKRAVSELRAEDPALSKDFTVIEIRDENGELVLKAPLSKRPGAA